MVTRRFRQLQSTIGNENYINVSTTTDV